jgi:hypothetical protein
MNPLMYNIDYLQIILTVKFHFEDSHLIKQFHDFALHAQTLEKHT